VDEPLGEHFVVDHARNVGEGHPILRKLNRNKTKPVPERRVAADRDIRPGDIRHGDKAREIRVSIPRFRNVSSGKGRDVPRDTRREENQKRFRVANERLHDVIEGRILLRTTATPRSRS
jgi:hypothetical protein